jgi:hypothetical protein
MCVALTKAVISTDSIEDTDDVFFPTVKELVSFFRNSGLIEEGLSEKPMQQTVDELAIEKSSYFSNPDKSASRDSSQGRHTQSSLS